MKSFKARFLTDVRSAGILRYVWISAIILAITGCADDEDDLNPRVQIESPNLGTTIFSVDTIIVDARISDNENLEFAEVGITNNEFIFISETQIERLSGTSTRLLLEYELNEPLLESGQYFFGVKANDGSNIGSAYQEINIIGAPLEVEKFIAVTQLGNTSRILTSEDLSNWNEVISLQNDFSGAALNYREDVFAICGGEMGDANFYSSLNWELIESIDGFGTPSMPFFLDLSFDQNSEQFLLMQSDPRARAFDKTAAPALSFPLLETHLPLKGFQADGRYFIDEKSILNPNHIFTVYNQGGILSNSFSLQGAVIGLHKKSLDSYFVWIDSPDGLELRELNASSGLLAPIFQRLGESLTSVIRLGNQEFLLSTSEGLLRYNFSNGGTAILNPELPESELVYDDLNGFIYSYEGSTVRTLSLAGDVVGSYGFSSDLVFFGVDYNR